MSGVYIRGISTPEEGYITITIRGDGAVVLNAEKKDRWRGYINEEIGKVIRVPDHGRPGLSG